MKNKSQRYDKYTKYKKCLSIIMIICIKHHLSNIWSSIHKKVKQHCDWVEKSVPCGPNVEPMDE